MWNACEMINSLYLESVWIVLLPKINKIQYYVHTTTTIFISSGNFQRKINKKPILVPIIIRKLDESSLSTWKYERPQREVAQLQPLLDFMNHRADSLMDSVDNYSNQLISSPKNKSCAKFHCNYKSTKCCQKQTKVAYNANKSINCFLAQASRNSTWILVNIRSTIGKNAKYACVQIVNQNVVH